MWTEPNLAQCYLCGTVRLVDSMLPAGNGLYQCKGIVMCLNRVRRSRGQLMISRKPKLPRGRLTSKLKQLIAAMAGTERPKGTIASTLQNPIASLAGFYLPAGGLSATLQEPISAIAGEHRPYETIFAAAARPMTASMTGLVGVSGPATFGAVGTPSTGSNSTTALIPVPAGVVAGSGVVVLMYIETNQAVTPPAGFIEAPSSPAVATGTQAHSLRLFEHVATGAESGNYTFTVASGLFWQAGQAIRFDNVGQLGGSIFDVANSASKSTTTDGTIPAVSVTTTGANRLLLWCAANFAGGTDTTPPTGFTERENQQGYDISTKLQSTAGASGSLTGTVNASSATTAWVGALLPGVTTGSSGGSYDITGATYYVSGNGNDANNGLSPATAWRTVARAMQRTFTAGEGLLFERGSTYYYNTINQTPTASGSKRWIIGAYGTGAMPVMSHYKFANLSGGWTLHSTGVWKINLGDSTTHTGYNSGAGLYANVGVYASTGYLMINGVMKVNKKSALSGLSVQWDFYNDNDFLYVRSTANPTTLASDIRIATDTRQLYLHHNMEVRDLEFTGCGGSALDSVAAADNVVVKGNYIHDVGGSYLFGTTQWGNGVTTWTGSTNWLVTENDIRNTYDCGVSPQGDGNISNIAYTYNTFHNCSQSYEFAPFTNAGTYSNISFEHNTCYDSGYGSFSPTLPNQDRRAALMMTINGGTLVNCTVRFNTFIGAIAYRFDYPDFSPNINYSSNDIRLAAGTLMQRYSSETIEQAAAFVARTGDEIGSTFTVL